MGKWMTLVVVCALGYAPLGEYLAGTGRLELLAANMVAYLLCALVILVVFPAAQRKLGERLRGSDAFGRTEYYLGMGSGLLRYGCVMLVFLAFLNARAFSPAELRAIDRFQEQNFGSALFPTLHSLQVTVFERSLTGGLIKQHLEFLLIAPTLSDPPPNQPRMSFGAASR